MSGRVEGDAYPEHDGAIRLALTRRTLIRSAVGASLSASALVTAACGSSGSSSSPGAATGGVKRGGSLRFAISDAATTEKLDPALSFTTNDAIYCGAIYESLTTTDTQWNVKPALAESWQPNADATEWTFKLRQGVKFHDGTPLTSKDVVFTLQRLLQKDLGSSMYARLNSSVAASGITAPDDATVVLKLKRSDSLIPVALALRNAKIVKDGTTKFTVATAIGTGPFKLASWTPGRSWVVEKNPLYWQKGLPYLDRVTAVIVPDQSTKLQSVVSGQNDLTDAIELSSIASIKGNASVEMQKLDNRQSWVFAFDHTKKPFNDPKVVEAIKIGQDRGKILSSVLQGAGGVTADIPIPTDSQFFPQGLSTDTDVARAKSLLAEAGYANGLDIELNTSAVAAGMVEMATAFQQVMKPIGVNVKLKQWPTSAYWNKAWMQAPAFQDYWNSRHPADMLSLFYRSDAVWNEASYKDPAFDKQIDAVFATTDEAKQRSLIQDAYKYAAQKVPYAIPVFAPQVNVHKKNVKGLELNYSDYVSLTKVTKA
jgi:peptide/nickel transport system substrate-binding protein